MNTDRILKEADYVIETGATVRRTATMFGVGKSTVHNDLTKKLKYVDAERYRLARRVLITNLAERHIRGGEATKRKYKSKS